MKTRNRVFAGVVLLALVSLAAQAGADTIDLSYKYVEAGGVLDVWLGSTHYYYGNLAADGVMRMATQNPSGPTAMQLPSAVWGACYELTQFVDFTPHTYTVNQLEAVFTPGKASLIRQLWANYYNHGAETNTPIFYGGSQGGFVAGQPANTAENVDSIAFLYALYEIRYDYTGTMASLNPTAGTFKLGTNQSPAGPPTVLQKTQAMLASLVDPASYNGPLPQLLALTNASFQDVIVEVPEPAAMSLLVVGGLAMMVRRRRR